MVMQIWTSKLTLGEAERLQAVSDQGLEAQLPLVHLSRAVNLCTAITKL